MQKKILLSTAACISALTATNVLALEFGAPIKTTVHISQQGLTGPSEKQIMLMNIKLTPAEQKMLFEYQPKKKSSLTDPNLLLPETTNLGMNNVPVLDQGRHGSCVTFAVTGALNALLGKGDYISQLCNLELGSYLENNSYFPSGWNGSFGSIVHDQILRFGIVNKENQKSKSCAGITEYPTNDWTNEGKPMPLDEFKSLSENMMESGQYYIVNHLDAFDRFSKKFSDLDQAEKVFQQVKKGLSNGNRLTFGTFLVLSPYCNAGACATHQLKEDTWALTKEIETPPYFTGGHEMVIIGYDDKAVAVDHDGKKHTGLFTLRNSWGSEVGHQGNFYMTYDYFKKFVMEVHEVAKFKF